MQAKRPLCSSDTLAPMPARPRAAIGEDPKQTTRPGLNLGVFSDGAEATGELFAQAASPPTSRPANLCRDRARLD